MGIARLKKEGWFDKKREEVHLPDLSENQIQDIKNGKRVIIPSGDDVFLIYIKEDADLEKLSESDLIIRSIRED